MRSEQQDSTTSGLDLDALRHERLAKLLHEANENLPQPEHPVLVTPPGVRRHGM